MLSYLNIIGATILLQMKNSFARPMFRFCLICNPIVNTIFLYELFLPKGMDAFISYVVIGAGLMGVWSCICFSSVGDINRERYMGTLSLIYNCPIGFGVIIFAKILGNTLLSAVTFLISYGTAVILSGQVMEIANIGAFIIALLVTAVSFIVISLCFAYVLMLSRKTELYMNLLEVPLIFLCGFTFPIEVLPEWVQRISECLAPTWGVRMLRMSVSGYNAEQFIHSGTILLIELCLMLLLTAILYHWVDIEVRKRATLEVS